MPVTAVDRATDYSAVPMQKLNQDDPTVIQMECKADDGSGRRGRIRRAYHVNQESTTGLQRFTSGIREACCGVGSCANRMGNYFTLRQLVLGSLGIIAVSTGTIFGIAALAGTLAARRNGNGGTVQGLESNSLSASASLTPITTTAISTVLPSTTEPTTTTTTTTTTTVETTKAQTTTTLSPQDKEKYRNVTSSLPIPILCKNKSWASECSVTYDLSSTLFSDKVSVDSNGFSLLVVPRQAANVKITWSQGAMWSFLGTTNTVTELSEIKNIQYINAGEGRATAVQIPKDDVDTYTKHAVDMINSIQETNIRAGHGDSGTYPSIIEKKVKELIQMVRGTKETFGIADSMENIGKTAANPPQTDRYRQIYLEGTHYVDYATLENSYPKYQMLEMAKLARYPYDLEPEMLGNWQIDLETTPLIAASINISVDESTGVISDDSSGLIAYVMKRLSSENGAQYCLCFGGTTSGKHTKADNGTNRTVDKKTKTQWISNTQLFLGNDPAIYQQAETMTLNLARQARNESATLITVGHSLGGGLAARGAAVATAHGFVNVRGYPFSASPLNRHMIKTSIIKALNENPSILAEDVVNSVIEIHEINDLVPSADNSAGTLNLFGQVVVLDSPQKPDVLKAHIEFLQYVQEFVESTDNHTRTKWDSAENFNV